MIEAALHQPAESHQVGGDEAHIQRRQTAVRRRGAVLDLGIARLVRRPRDGGAAGRLDRDRDRRDRRRRRISHEQAHFAGKRALAARIVGGHREVVDNAFLEPGQRVADAVGDVDRGLIGAARLTKVDLVAGKVRLRVGKPAQRRLPRGGGRGDQQQDHHHENRADNSSCHRATPPGLRQHALPLGGRQRSRAGSVPSPAARLSGLCLTRGFADPPHDGGAL